MERMQFPCRKAFLAIFLCLFIVFSVIANLPISAYAEEDEVSYSNVMDDLKKSANFSFSDYPNDPNDHNLYVEQIAESDRGELFIYVYNPCVKTTPYVAEDISMSNAASISDLTARWALYDLTLLNSEGVFAKYLVNGFTVKDDIVRYYDISEIHRPYNADVDEPVVGGETNYVACRVAKRYTVMTDLTGVHYACEATEVIEVTAIYAGFMRVKSGVFSSYDCDAHFVAFSTDKPMDKLMEADITYYKQEYRYSSQYQFDFWKVITGHGDEQTTVSDWHGEKVRITDTIAAGEKGTFQGDGWFAKEYSWDRIQTVQAFKNSADPDNTVVKAIDGMQWVLRFTETEYSNWNYSSPTGTSAGSGATGTDITEVTILRLMFETDGKVYNLGTVMDIVTADKVPDGEVWGVDFFGGSDSALVRFVKILLAVLAVILLLVVLAPVLPYVIQFIVWLILLPFKAIGALFKSISSAHKSEKARRNGKQQNNKG